MTSYKQSQVTSEGIKGTYTSKPFGGVGMGYQMQNGDVVKSGGNGWYYPVDVSEFTADGGQRYMDKVQSFAPSYR